jgi:hypothetical protein
LPDRIRDGGRITEICLDAGDSKVISQVGIERAPLHHCYLGSFGQEAVDNAAAYPLSPAGYQRRFAFELQSILLIPVKGQSVSGLVQ